MYDTPTSRPRGLFRNVSRPAGPPGIVDCGYLWPDPIRTHEQVTQSPSTILPGELINLLDVAPAQNHGLIAGSEAQPKPYVEFRHCRQFQGRYVLKAVLAHVIAYDRGAGHVVPADRLTVVRPTGPVRCARMPHFPPRSFGEPIKHQLIPGGALEKCSEH